MKITKEDVGRKVKLRDGSVATIDSFNLGREFPVKLSNRDSTLENGSFWSDDNITGNDIVGFIEEPLVDLFDRDIVEEHGNLQIEFIIDKATTRLELSIAGYDIVATKKES